MIPPFHLRQIPQYGVNYAPDFSIFPNWLAVKFLCKPLKFYTDGTVTMSSIGVGRRCASNVGEERGHMRCSPLYNDEARYSNSTSDPSDG